MRGPGVAVATPRGRIEARAVVVTLTRAELEEMTAPLLRRTLRDYLKSDKKVESFHDAEANQGGHGVTIVNLRA